VIPTEHEYTVATHAAAKALVKAQHPEIDYDTVPLAQIRPYLEAVLPIVDAAISAIPDRRSDAWIEIRALHERSTFTAEEIHEVLRGNRS
jgi:hypothetical protein